MRSKAAPMCKRGNRSAPPQSSSAFALPPSGQEQMATAGNHAGNRTSMCSACSRKKDRAKADPMKLEGWEFYVLPTKVLDRHCGVQKTIRLRSLFRLHPEKDGFLDLKAAVLRSVGYY